MAENNSDKAATSVNLFFLWSVKPVPFAGSWLLGNGPTSLSVTWASKGPLQQATRPRVFWCQCTLVPVTQKLTWGRWGHSSPKWVPTKIDTSGPNQTPTDCFHTGWLCVLALMKCISGATEYFALQQRMLYCQVDLVEGSVPVSAVRLQQNTDPVAFVTMSSATEDTLDANTLITDPAD